ncbi:hypothetical protein STIUS_v1c01670 [Spiroplasma sp. TIUS-1]|uniref:hypothetical protein n=1 Tax=Spiroplasma sp. TIUS-1 TaxID=216963 RepID=UPI001399365E|nr:hypothetical protein [Spiroplasma sp. TIUS-1]QHX35722.1 hypothetical protein STIUS_v1c01670 [Spiroplasma sp. TIUS-1]
MAREEYKSTITDVKLIEEFNAEFESLSKQFDKRIYGSVTEERSRASKLIINQKLKKPVEEVFSQFLIDAAYSIHTSLKAEDLYEGGFYRTSGKSNKLITKVSKLELNKEISIIWYANNQQFIRSIKFYSNKKNTVTNIKFFNLATGMTSVAGYLERHLRTVYAKRQKVSFEVQIMRTQMALGIIPKEKHEATNKKIVRYLKYAENLY